jgi:hypothetical protein
MGAYEDNLRHVAEPASPSERDKAVSTTIEDHEALWFTEALREFAHYGDTDNGEVAVAYASFIDKKVRDEGKSYVTLYAHTETAAETLMDALYHHIPEPGSRDDTPMTLVTTLEDAFAEAFAHYVDDPETPDAPPEPQVTDIDGEETVVFDEDEARESYAIAEMEKAESEAVARQEREADRRGVTGLPETNPALERAEARERVNRGGRR